MPILVAQRFTKETARAASAKAKEARAENLRRLKADSARLRVLEAALRRNDPASFASSILTRVRTQCTGLLDIMDAERGKADPDGQRLNWLASALERMAELERVLAGRPTPGALRPSAAAARRAAMPSFSVTVPDQELPTAAPVTESPPIPKESL